MATDIANELTGKCQSNQKESQIKFLKFENDSTASTECSARRWCPTQMTGSLFPKLEDAVTLPCSV